MHTVCYSVCYGTVRLVAMAIIFACTCSACRTRRVVEQSHEKASIMQLNAQMLFNDTLLLYSFTDTLAAAFSPEFKAATSTTHPSASGLICPPLLPFSTQPLAVIRHAGLTIKSSATEHSVGASRSVKQPAQLSSSSFSSFALLPLIAAVLVLVLCLPRLIRRFVKI